MTSNPNQTDPNRPNNGNPILRILRNASWSLSGKAIGAVLSLIYLAMIARSLGPIDFGRFALIFSFAQAICGFVTFPTWQIILRYGTKYVIDQLPDKFAQLIMVCLAMDFAGLCVGIALAGAALYGFGDYFDIPPEMKAQILGFSVILLLSVRGTVIGILRAHDRFREVALSESLLPIIRFIGVIVAIYTGPSVQAFLLIWALSEIVTTAVLWLVSWRKLYVPLARQNIGQIPSYYARYVDLTRFTGFASLATILRVISQQMIVLAVGALTGAAAAGFFRLGHQLGQILARISDGISIAFYAEHNRMSHSDHDSAVASMVRRTIKISLVSAVFMLTVLLLFGKIFIVTIFGEAFAPAYLFVILLGAAAAIQLGSSALEPVLLAKGQAGWALLANIIGTVILLVALYLLVSKYGAVGAAIAILLGSVTNAAVLALLYRRLA